MLSMITRGGGCSFCARAATSMPLSLGIAISRMRRSGRSSSHMPQRIQPIGGLADDGDAGLRFEQGPHAAADDAVVVS